MGAPESCWLCSGQRFPKVTGKNQFVEMCMMHNVFFTILVIVWPFTTFLKLFIFKKSECLICHIQRVILSIIRLKGLISKFLTSCFFMRHPVIYRDLSHNPDITSWIYIWRHCSANQMLNLPHLKSYFEYCQNPNSTQLNWIWG